MIKIINKVVRDSFNFSGRAGRREYWMWYLFTFIFGVVAIIIEGITGLGGINMLASLLLFIPSLSVAVRRLHDSNKSGWNYLWSLIPIFGTIYVLYLLIRKGSNGENDYGQPVN